MKLLIGVITFEGEKYCRDEFIASLSNLTWPVFDVVFVTNSGEEDADDLRKRLATFNKGNVQVITSGFQPQSEKGSTAWNIDHCANNREQVRKYFLDGDWTHLLFVDSDTFIPINTIEVLSAHNKNVVSGVCLGSEKDADGSVRMLPAFWISDPAGKLVRASIHEALIPRLAKVAAVGMACCLLERPSLDVPFKLFSDTQMGEDIQYSSDALEAGYELWVDTRVQCVHLKFPFGDERNKFLDLRNYKLDVKKK